MKKLILLIALFSIFIAGCTNSGQDAQTFESPYIGGNSGLLAEFELMGSTSENSVNEVWEDESFPIEVILRNKGEKDLEPSQVTVNLKGFAQNDFSGIQAMQKSNPSQIEKVSEFLPDGGEDRLNFGNAQYAVGFDGFYDAVIQAQINYYYETYLAVPQVCFKQDVRDESVCNIDETKTHYVSSGPIQVTSVQQSPGGKGIIYLTIEVKNTGGFTGQGRSAVPGEEIKYEYDRIAFEALGTNSNPNLWDCTSGGVGGVARMPRGDGTTTIRCKATVPTNALNPYLQQFSLILKYNYQEDINQNVRIKEALE